MLQRYRLRLGDGTLLQVDKEGLHAWVADDARAMVQIAGTQQWRPLREFLAEEESAARLARALVPPEPRRGAAPAPPEAEPPVPKFEPAIGEPPVQALAEEPSSPTPPWQAPPEAPGAEGHEIRLKPLEDEPHSPADELEIIEEETPDPYAVPRPRAYAAAEEEEEVVGHDSLEGPLLQVVTAFGTVLSQLLGPLTPLVSGWPSSSRTGGGAQAARRMPRAPREVQRAPAPPTPDAPATSPEPPPAFEPPGAAAPPPQVSVLAEDPGFAAASQDERDGIPVVPLKSLDEDERPVTSAWRGLSEKATEWVARLSAAFAALSAWVAALPARIQDLRDRKREPEPVVPPIQPAPRRAPTVAPRPPEPPRTPAPLRAPTPVAELPSIRLAEGWEAPEEGDVYDGEEVEAWSVLPVVWRWTKRVVLVGGLATVGVLAARSWETWFPRAAELGETVFTEIDRQAHSAQRAREKEQAVTNATEMCPHLAPETIRLVLSTSSDGVLEPPEVFQLATEAADRGIDRLPPAEAAELRGLQRELVAQLRPPQRARLAEYDRARATRAVFPFENPHALDLVAQGARAMPAASRARLQHLLGKAVAAGLGLPPASPAAAPAGASVVP